GGRGAGAERLHQPLLTAKLPEQEDREEAEDAGAGEAGDRVPPELATPARQHLARAEPDRDDERQPIDAAEADDALDAVERRDRSEGADRLPGPNHLVERAAIEVLAKQ